MKKILLVFSVFFAVAAYSQRYATCEFRFDKPTTLYPPVTPPTEVSGIVLLTDSIFWNQEHNVSVSFVRDPEPGLGCNLVTTYNEEGIYPFLRFYRGGKMVIEGHGVTLDSFKFSESSVIGGLILSDPQNVGYVDPWENWTDTSHDKNITRLVYENTGNTPQIRYFTVGYYAPQDILNPLSTYPDQPVSSFTSFTLSFSANVYLNGSPVITMTKDNSNDNIILTATTEGNFVTLASDIAIEEIGTYTISIPENSFVDEKGNYNPLLCYVIEVVEAQKTFKYVSAVPAEGVLDNLPNEFLLMFNDSVGGINPDPSLRVSFEDKNRDSVRYASVVIDDNDPEYKTVKVVFDNGMDDVKHGIYYLTIPERMVYNSKYNDQMSDLGESDGALFNPEIKLEYNFGNVQFPSAAILAKAKSVLDYTGIGTPTNDSSARQTLSKMVATGMGKNEDFIKAINDFYAETEIELPMDGKCYQVSFIDSLNNKRFLSYSNNAIILTSNPDQAARLFAQHNDDGTTSLYTYDGHYLHQLQPYDFYTETTTSNVTNSYNELVNNLTFSRFLVSGVDAEKTFGLFTMSGCLGKYKNVPNATYETAYALVNVLTGEILTHSGLDPVNFKEGITNAVQLEQVAPPVPDAEYTLLPSNETTLRSLRQLEISFPSLTNVDISTDLSIKLIRTDNYQELPATHIERVENTTNAFVIGFDDPSNGAYILYIPKGTFIYEKDGEIVSVQEISVQYEVEGSDFVYDFDRRPELLYLEGLEQDNYISDVALNNYTWYVNYMHYLAPIDSINKIDPNFRFGISDKIVRIIAYYYNREVARGHYERLEGLIVDGVPAKDAMKLVLDEPIVENSLPAGKYALLIEKGTFGDSNYAKYLEDPYSVDKSDCHVNATLCILRDVDNMVTGLESLFNNKPNDVIFDLQGRRVEGKAKSGVYIVNGRKVIIK